MALKLTGKQLEGLQTALLSAFRDRSKLQQLLLFKMDENLNEVVGPGNLKTVTMDLIVWASAEGRLEELIVAAGETVPGNPDLKSFLVEVGLFSDQPPDDGGPVQGRLEAMVVEGLGFQDVVQWRKRMRAIEAATCMVETDDDKGWGTGFLVAPDVIMTNDHVTTKLKQKGGTPQVRFGYIRQETGPGADSGVVVKAIDNDWELAGSPPTELDFSLLRLSEKAADHVFEGSKRGFLDVRSAHEFIKDEPILIVQHPQRDPLQLGVGYLKDVNNLVKRISYTTNTERGSSGSPCFSLGWDLVAIHHQGDKFTNHGTPMKAIVEHLEAEGKGQLLG